MKTYKWCYPDINGEPIEEYITEDEIIDEYFGKWSDAMLAKGLNDRINREDCILDWVMVRWAVEIETSN